MAFRLIVATAALALAVPASFATDAPSTAAPGADAPAASATAPEGKPSRLRFRSANGTCACTCAKGGMSEAQIRRAEEARPDTKN
jgi:hypothetical protein